jgi:phospholipid/cholesterol/gamma-HCH transport system substrate-binding protein
MKGFSERNPITIAVVGLVTLAAVATATYYSDDLPLIGGGTRYAADFGDAAGLKSGDDVRIAGVKVGTVQSIQLSHTHVLIGFKVKDAWVGDQTTAAIGIKTLLGQEYIALTPKGSAKQDPGHAIPQNRTSTPLDVAAALDGLSSTVGSIDTTQLANGFDALSNAFADTPASVQSALSGLSRLSRTISSRDTELQALADQAERVTSTLAESNDKFADLIKDGGVLLGELQARSSAITELLQGTRDLASQLSGLVHDDEKTLGPALKQLTKVSDILSANQGNLKKALNLIGPYYSTLNDATGSGPWLDIYLCGLFDAKGDPVLDKNALRNCAAKRGTGK